jgi:hypothetical protein
MHMYTHMMFLTYLFTHIFMYTTGVAGQPLFAAAAAGGVGAEPRGDPQGKPNVFVFHMYICV